MEGSSFPLVLSIDVQPVLQILRVQQVLSISMEVSMFYKLTDFLDMRSAWLRLLIPTSKMQKNILFSLFFYLRVGYQIRKKADFKSNRKIPVFVLLFLIVLRGVG